jgi:hypothetical protein
MEDEVARLRIDLGRLSVERDHYQAMATIHKEHVATLTSLIQRLGDVREQMTDAEERTTR